LKFQKTKGAKKMTIQTVFIIGSGQMGRGIAQTFAQSGFQTILHDISEEIVQKNVSFIKKQLARQVEKGKLQQVEMDEIYSRIQTTTSLEDATKAQLVIEAVVENMEVKKQIFSKLDLLLPKEVILASNTSSLPITKIAAGSRYPERFVGMHFMNPVPVMKLVEIISGLATANEVTQAIREVSLQLNKVPVEVKDFPGFVSNRVLMPMINEAIYCLYEGIATKEDIDTVMKLGMNHPMGPLQLADYIGLDTCLSILEILHEGFGEDKYRPCPLLKQYVMAGWLGKKTNRGFYVYE